MAKAKVEVEQSLGEVEYVLGDVDMTIYLSGNEKVVFLGGKALVTADTAAKLKESQLIK